MEGRGGEGKSTSQPFERQWKPTPFSPATTIKHLGSHGRAKRRILKERNGFLFCLEEVFVGGWVGRSFSVSRNITGKKENGNGKLEKIFIGKLMARKVATRTLQ